MNAWMHGDSSNDIRQMRLGLVGPRIAHDGIDDTPRPTTPTSLRR
jgi:hypothetical protein